MAGNMAKFFINFAVTAAYLAMLMLGILGLMYTLRQEDPQIEVLMVDLIVQYPGAEPEQVASLAYSRSSASCTRSGCGSRLSASQRGMGIVTVQFDVGEEMENSLVKVNDKLESNMDRILRRLAAAGQGKGHRRRVDRQPDSAGEGLQRRCILTSMTRSCVDLQSVLQHIKEIPETGNSFVVGGRAEQ